MSQPQPASFPHRAGRFITQPGSFRAFIPAPLPPEPPILRLPLLYLSHYLKQHRAEYYDRLMAIRTSGHWEQWVKFFLRGVAEVSQDATDTARKILVLRENSRARIVDHIGMSVLALRLLDLLFLHPVINIKFAQQKLDCSYVKASQLMDAFHAEPLALVEETTGFRRNRRFRFRPYLALFPEPPVKPAESATPEP